MYGMKDLMKRLAICLALAGTLASSSTLTAQQQNIVETAAAAGNFNTLLTAAKAAGLADALSGHDQLTVFAPTDEAFQKLDPALVQSLLQPENKDKLAAILKFHVVPGRVSASQAYQLDSANSLLGQRLNINLSADLPSIEQAQILATDIGCSNGVIHVIDTVMLPALDNIPQTATNAGTFDTLLAAVGAAELANVLGGPGPFTVFAPTDDAFAALPAGTVENLLLPENKSQLVEILKYHVVSGRVYDDQAVEAGQAPTLLGRSLNVNVSASGLSINEANVVAKNIDASNGVIHVIDAVLIPSSMSSHDAMNTLLGAVERGSAVFNAGHHGQCCEIYMNTMTQLMQSGISGADEHTMQMIQNTLTQARSTHGMTDRAWVLRHGIDNLYRRMASMPAEIR